MKYKIIEGKASMKKILDDLRKSPVVTHYYIGQRIQSVYSEDSGISHEQGEIIAVGKTGSKLIKKFNELVQKKGIRLETI